MTSITIMMSFQHQLVIAALQSLLHSAYIICRNCYQNWLHCQIIM